jgi:hypothetical protein
MDAAMRRQMTATNVVLGVASLVLAILLIYHLLSD